MQHERRTVYTDQNKQPNIKAKKQTHFGWAFISETSSQVSIATIESMIKVQFSSDPTLTDKSQPNAFSSNNAQSSC
jgi:hypothetical protein